MPAAPIRMGRRLRRACPWPACSGVHSRRRRPLSARPLVRFGRDHVGHGARGGEIWLLESRRTSYRPGTLQRQKTGSIAGYDLLRSNPEEWALKVALPLFQSHGVNVDDTNAMSKAINEISRGNKNLNVILDDCCFRRTGCNSRRNAPTSIASPIEAAAILQRNDPALAMQAFTTQWDNLLTALGKPLVADAVAALNKVTEAIQGLAKLAGDHPEITKIGAESAAVAAGLLTLAGAIGVLKFALNIGRGAAALSAIGAAGRRGKRGRGCWRRGRRWRGGRGARQTAWYPRGGHRRDRMARSKRQLRRPDDADRQLVQATLRR